MGLLHSLGMEGLPAALWELGRQAQASGLPQPPPLKLPVLPALGTSCNPAALARLLGEEAARQLTERLQQPEVQDLLTGHLDTLKAQMQGYLDTLATQQAQLTNELTAVQERLSVLSGIQDLLSGLSTELSSERVTAIAQACPAVGGLLVYAAGTAGNLEADLQGVTAQVTTLITRLADLVELRSAADELIGQLDAHRALADQFIAGLSQMTGDP